MDVSGVISIYGFKSVESEGLPPQMQSSLYETIAKSIKERHPELHLHAFSPEEVLWGARRSGSTIHDFLLRLKDAGVDSLPGTSAEILDDELRSKVAKNRISVEKWMEVISTAHRLGFPTTSTMMFGFCESPRHLAKHLILLRDLQKKAQESGQRGFTEFVPLGFVASEAPMWRKMRERETQSSQKTIQAGSEELAKQVEGSQRETFSFEAKDHMEAQHLPGDSDSIPLRPGPTGVEVLRAHAVARLVFNPFLPGGIRNIQVSWVKEGFKMAQFLLNCGVNDLGGTLMNESISTAAGARHGQLAKPRELRQLVWDLEHRSVAERSTCYDILRRFEREESKLSKKEELGLTLDALDGVKSEKFGSFQQLISSSDFRFASPKSHAGGGVHPTGGNRSRQFSSQAGPRASFSSTSSPKTVITYSPSFTLVPTYECFNSCSYCNFRRDVTSAGAWMEDAEAIRKLQNLKDRSNGDLRVVEILVMSGEVHPKAKNRAAWLRRAKDICSLSLDYGFLPHTNIGPLSRKEMMQLFEVNASMGLMLETVSPLNGQGEVHQFAPSKVPSLRIEQIRQAGELKVPFTTGLLLGIGETETDRLKGLEMIASMAEEFKHIQEVILQPHSLGSSQKLKPQTSRSGKIMFGHDAKAVLPELVRAARKILPPEVTIQVPPNLILTSGEIGLQPENWQVLLECIENGARDLGGISPQDEVNPDFAFPNIHQLRDSLGKEGYHLQPRLPVYPRHFSWLSARVQESLRSFRFEDSEAPLGLIKPRLSKPSCAGWEAGHVES